MVNIIGTFQQIGRDITGGAEYVGSQVERGLGAAGQALGRPLPVLPARVLQGVSGIGVEAQSFAYKYLGLGGLPGLQGINPNSYAGAILEASGIGALAGGGFESLAAYGERGAIDLGALGYGPIRSLGRGTLMEFNFAEPDLTAALEKAPEVIPAAEKTAQEGAVALEKSPSAWLNALKSRWLAYPVIGGIGLFAGGTLAEYGLTAVGQGAANLGQGLYSGVSNLLGGGAAPGGGVGGGAPPGGLGSIASSLSPLIILLIIGVGAYVVLKHEAKKAS